MKAFKIILVTLAILAGLIYFIVWYAFRTTSEDVSHLKPFSDIVGKELIIVQPCRIGLYHKKHSVKENQYLLAVTGKMSASTINCEELPKGTKLKIKEAKEFRNGVTGFKSTYVLGSVYLESLQKEVQFEYAWGSKNYGTDLPGDYFSYSIAPWQNSPIDVMYNYEEGIEVPYQNYNIKQDTVLESLQTK